MLDGIGEFAAEGLQITSVRASDASIAAGPQPVIIEFSVDRNPGPQSTIVSFCSVVLEVGVYAACAPLLDFCYVDIDANTDIGALFGLYEQALDPPVRVRPALAIRHVTFPLRSLSSGPLMRLRSLLDRHHPQVRNYATREAFNERPRRTYGFDGALFCLADLTSCDATGNPRMVAGPRGDVRALLPDYGADCKDVDTRRRRILARQFVAYVERLAARSEGGAVRRLST